MIRLDSTGWKVTMTLTIAISTHQGIALGADKKRLNVLKLDDPKPNGPKYVGLGRKGSTKLVPYGSHACITWSGQGGIGGRDFVDILKGFTSNNDKPTVKDTANELHALLEGLKKSEPEGVDKGPFSTVALIVAGYDLQGARPKRFIVDVPGEVKESRTSSQNNGLGISATGRNYVLPRVLQGLDPSLTPSNIPSDLLENNKFNIDWEKISLKDAIELIRHLIEFTTQLEKVGHLKLDEPDWGKDVPAFVGDGIDLAVITPDNGFEWVV